MQDDSLTDSSRRAAILDQATQLFLERGYAGTSMSAIAEQCGLRKASLYHHFPSKEALFTACVTDAYHAASVAMERIRDAPGLSDEERLTQAFAELYRVAVESDVGRLSPIIAEVALRFPEVARAFHDSFVTRQHEAMIAIIEHGVQHGAFRPLDRLALEHLIFGPPVTLALSREMFAAFENRDELLPVAAIRDGHCDLVLRLLVGR
jgi:AcrR family transcriptional regulator